MIILGIESSCDETAAAILKDGELLSNVVVSQIDIFKSYGGVIPEVAARSHLEAILPVIDKAIEDAKVNWDLIDYIAVTHTPGLLGSLLIGTLTARTLAILHNKPLYAIHHLKSHIYSNWLGEGLCSGVSPIPQTPAVQTTTFTKRVRGDVVDERRTECCGLDDCGARTRTNPELKPSTPTFPLLALVISGGHTQIIYMPKHNDFQIIGTTLDDAVGECFDKIAKILGLPYPGGPSIAKAAEKGNSTKYRFPHPQVDGLNFSFSGLKTAVLRTVQKECDVGLDYPSHDLKNLLTPEQIADFAASFQKTAIDILLEKLNLALSEYGDIKSIVFAGGVSANKELRKAALNLEVSPGCAFRDNKEPRPAVDKNLDTDFEPRKTRGQNPPVKVFSTTAARLPVEKSTAGLTPATRTERETSPRIFFPPLSFSGDNAAMVAMAAYWEIKSGVSPTDPYKLTLAPRSLLC